jgi:hypothetical protein
MRHTPIGYRVAICCAMGLEHHNAIGTDVPITQTKTGPYTKKIYEPDSKKRSAAAVTSLHRSMTSSSKRLIIPHRPRQHQHRAQPLLTKRAWHAARGGPRGRGGAAPGPWRHGPRRLDALVVGFDCALPYYIAIAII